MTTAHSPLSALKTQANKIAAMMKQAERGSLADPTGKVAAARANKDGFKTAVIMDDKILTIEMPWATIRETSETGIAEYVLKHMRETREHS